MEGFTGAGGHVHAYMRKLRLAYVERSILVGAGSVRNACCECD